MLLVPFTLCVQKPGERYSMISYNFVLRRLLDMIGCSDLGIDFPPLKDKGKRIKLVVWWLRMIKHLRWPYINSDGQLFGDEYFVDIFKLEVDGKQCVSRGEQRQPRRKAGERNTQDPETECVATAEDETEQWVADLVTLAEGTHSRDGSGEFRWIVHDDSREGTASVSTDTGVSNVLGDREHRARPDVLRWLDDFARGGGLTSYAHLD